MVAIREEGYYSLSCLAVTQVSRLILFLTRAHAWVDIKPQQLSWEIHYHNVL